MTGTIRRGSPPRRRVAAKRKVVKPSIIDRLLGLLPFSEATLRVIASWIFVALGGTLLVLIANFFGVPGTVGTALAESAGRAGFRVEQIEITGLKRMDRMTVYAAALDQQSRAMPLVDLDAVRLKLKRYGWIADAHVSRRLPDTLLIEIVERKPAAVWQQDGKLALIDAEGIILSGITPAQLPKLPLVIGPGANQQEPARQQLLAAAPALSPRIQAASWVGNRRWNILFDSGETLALPEGDAAARDALVKFAEMDGADRLLGKGWVRFDMRDPTRMVARRANREEVTKKVADPESGAAVTNESQPVGTGAYSGQG